MSMKRWPFGSSWPEHGHTLTKGTRLFCASGISNAHERSFICMSRSLAFAFMASDANMFPALQIDFSVSSQEAKAEGTTGQYKEFIPFMVGSHQWRLRCYPTGMKDHQWMSIPTGISVFLVPINKTQMVGVSLLLWIHTFTHAYDLYARILLLSSLWLHAST